MSVVYSAAAITARLVAVGGRSGTMDLNSNSGILATVGTGTGSVTDNILDYSAGDTTTAVSSGTVTWARMEDNSNNPTITPLTVGIPVGPEQVIISNGLNSTVIETGQTVEFLGGTIVTQ